MDKTAARLPRKDTMVKLPSSLCCAVMGTIAAVCMLLGPSDAASSPPQEKLSDVFAPKMLGADLAFFEKVTGPARNTFGDTKTYDFAGCEISAGVASGTVESLSISLSPKCTFDLNPFLPNFAGKIPNLVGMTFGQFDKLSQSQGTFYADCLSECGNAYDPVVYEHWSSSRADGFLEVMLGATQTGDAVLDAADSWQSAMEKAEGADWVQERKFNCAPKHDQVAHEAFRNVAIDQITIGHQLRLPSCD